MSREIPKYQIIETDLIDNITQGAYSDTNMLPTEAELVEELIKEITLS